MTLEFNGVHSGGDPNGTEHQAGAKAKRVSLMNVIAPAPDKADKNRSMVPLAVAGSFQMEKGKVYRLISAAAFNFNLANSVVAATSADILVPAATAVHVVADLWTTLNVAGTVQVVEVV